MAQNLSFSALYSNVTKKMTQVELEDQIFWESSACTNGSFHLHFHISQFPGVTIKLKMTNCSVPAQDSTRSSLQCKSHPSSLEYKHVGAALQGDKDKGEPSATMNEVNLLHLVQLTHKWRICTKWSQRTPNWRWPYSRILSPFFSYRLVYCQKYELLWQFFYHTAKRIIAKQHHLKEGFYILGNIFI